MTNKDYETDNSMFECSDEADFQSFIEEREQASEWTEATVREMKIEAATAFSPKGTISEESRREASFLVKHPQIGELYLRDISVSSLLERARIGGYALGELSRDDFAYIVTKCLETARINDMTKIRVQEGKAAAFMASSYKIIPQPEVFRQTAEHLTSQFGGSFSKGVWSHSLSLAEYSVSLPVEDYEDIFKSKGMSFSDITMSVSVMTSDTGHSGANIYPSVIGTMPGGRKYRVPILGSICMDHKEKANIKEFESNLSLAFSQTEKSKERIRELDAISLNYPFNCFCNILKKVGIGKKQAVDVLNRFAVTIGNDAPATAADVYFKACEITFEPDQNDTLGMMTLDENIAKILKLSDKSWSDFDRPLNCWSFNI